MGWTKSEGLEGALARRFEKEHSELLWLAYLLTGDRDKSHDAVVNAMDVNDTSNPFFRNWMISWSRKLVIAKALDSMKSELSASLARTREWHRPEEPENPADHWSLQPDADKAEIEEALLGIDLFPRCALLLSVFEKVSVEDTATLLNADRETIRLAKTIGLEALARALEARERERAASTAIPAVAFGLAS